MKTNKFEKTIRQKLESISPNFQESDWAQMQKYMQAHTPPTFWQQYGSWLGYAAAASVTVAMAFMYITQLSQNNQLRADVKTLQNQIAAISEKTIENNRPDTVYIIQKEDFARHNNLPISLNDSRQAESGYIASRLDGRNETILESQDSKEVDTHFISSANDALALKKTPEVMLPDDPRQNASAAPENLPELQPAQTSRTVIVSNKNTTLLDKTLEFQPGNESSDLPQLTGISDRSTGSSPILKYASVKSLNANFDNIAQQKTANANAINDKMAKQLTNRLSPKQVRKEWMQATANNYNIAAVKKTQQVKQSENVIPRLKLKVPYRFGAGLEMQEGVQAKTITGEVVVSKKFSVSAGLSWLKVKPMEFFTEKMFKEKNKQDFKQTHPNQVPVAFVVTNINVEPSVVQIPLTIAYRNEMRNDWTIYAGAGANITLNSKEKISYNCLVPSPRQGKEFITDSFERKLDISPVNAVNFSAGIEKAWHPIVFQAEGYIYNYFKPLTPLTQRNGPGVKVKLLYQIGKKM